MLYRLLLTFSLGILCMEMCRIVSHQIGFASLGGCKLSNMNGRRWFKHHPKQLFPNYYQKSQLWMLTLFSISL